MLHTISSYIHAQGASSAPGIIECYFSRGRITAQQREWLLNVWKGE